MGNLTSILNVLGENAHGLRKETIRSRKNNKSRNTPDPYEKNKPSNQNEGIYVKI
jgi:hypothetical protein